jgi:AsmA protein
MRRGLHIALASVAAVIVAVFLAALIATYVVLQPERFTALLQSQARAAGLELTLASPASPTLWPNPSLELDGITLRGNGASTPLIVASRGKIVLPWRTLMGGDAVISRLEVEGARIDVDAISAYVDTLPSRPSTAGAILPGIDAGFRISRSTLLRGNRLLLSNVDIDAGRLANGHRFNVSLAAHTPDETPYTLDLETTPQLLRGVLTLADLTIDAASKDRFTANLQGDATWRGGADIGASLAGHVARKDGKPYDLVLGVAPANQQDPLSIGIKLDGETDHADVHLPPLAVADWWAAQQGVGAPALPPVQGTVDAARVDLGDIHATGLRIRATPDMPAAASTTAEPAGTQ